jgi:dTDP-4-amino-4,6-dideoxygalactose transaminase
MNQIPFNKPFVVGEELYYMARSVMEGHTAPNGQFTEACRSYLEGVTGAEAVLLTTSCTAALEMAAMLCNLQPGDEVILPSYTFVSTANAFCLFGAVPCFVDIRPDTLNLDESLVAQAITERTRAIVPVHYAGVSCEMDELLRLGRQNNCLVIEDAAQALCSTYKGRQAGAIGDLGTFSFHETKNFICGEGGALALRDEQFVARAEMLLEDGTNRRDLFRGNVDHYEWMDVGSSLAMPDLLAAFLLAQLRNADKITTKRRALHARYTENLTPLAERGLVTLPAVPENCESNYHLFYVLFEDMDTRTRAIAHLKEAGIQSVFHYVALHTSPVGIRYGYGPGSLPVTERVSDCLLRLPMYYELSLDDVNRVTATLGDFFGVKQ